MSGTTRRETLALTAAAMAATPAIGAGRAPFEPSWTSLAAGYQVPDWFRDAKFGIWAHWSAQCVPEFGDWYARLMYVQGNPFYDHHLKTYGHPSRTGFMEIENLWKAEHWEPDALIGRYKAAGARYFMALGCHHDNLDTWNSRYHALNALRVGPRRDIVGGWAKAAWAAGLRFGISNHSSHSWHFYGTAYGYDAKGTLAGKRYDAYWLRKEMGRGTWWDGLDPQELYNQLVIPPDGLTTDAAMNSWQDAHGGDWPEYAPPGPRGAAYAAKWLARQTDMVEQYRPDMVYLDDTQLPFGTLGLQAAASYYNQSVARTGHTDVVLTAKKLTPLQTHGIVEDVERGFSDHLRPNAWQTDTCIGNWHYDRALYERHGYRTAPEIAQRLCDTVSKNGNLMLSIPMKADGTHDPDEIAFLDAIGRWFAANGEGIYGTRPWRIYGEGPTATVAGQQNEQATRPFTAADIRFTVGQTRGRPLHAFLLDWPNGPARIAALGTRALGGARVEAVRLLGGGPLAFRQEEDALVVTMPPADGRFVPGLRIDGRGIA